jgi:hypothetical protein
MLRVLVFSSFVAVFYTGKLLTTASINKAFKLKYFLEKDAGEKSFSSCGIGFIRK